MEQFLAVMLLVGCSADQKVCSEIPVPTPFYTTVDDCQSDLALQMRFSSTYDERVFGACTGVDEAMLEQSGTVDWAVSRAGELIVEIHADEPELASLDATSAEAAESGSGSMQVAVR